MNRKISSVPWGYQSQSIAVLVFLASLLVMLFFRSDVLLGAVGLRAVYDALGVPLSLLLILISLGLLVLWSKISSLVGILIWVVLVAALAEFVTLGWVLALASVFFVITTQDLLAVVIPVAFVFCFLFWLLVQARRYLLPGCVVKIVVMAVLLVAATLSLGGGAFSRLDVPALVTNEYQSLQFNDHFYFLSAYFSSDGEWLQEWLQLYECNSLGLFCTKVYSGQRGASSYKKLALVPDEATNGVTI